MGLPGLVRGQMPETVDHVESRVHASRQAEVRHVADENGGWQPMSPQPGIAVRYRARVQVQPTDVVAQTAQPIEQSSRTAGRLEQSLYGPMTIA